MIWIFVALSIAVRLMVAGASLYGLLAYADRAESKWMYTLAAMTCFIAFWCIDIAGVMSLCRMPGDTKIP